MRKNNYFQYSVTLGLICLIVSVILSLGFSLTRSKIIFQQSKEENSGLKEVYPEARGFDPVKEMSRDPGSTEEEIVYYNVLDEDKNVLGYCFKALVRGYSGDIITLVGMTKEGTINRIKVITQNETPGLGTKIAEIEQKETLATIFVKKEKDTVAPRPWFQQQFDHKRVDELNFGVHTITGATVSSKAVIDSVQKKAKIIARKVKERQEELLSQTQ